jgi:hypothetical protein
MRAESTSHRHAMLGFPWTAQANEPNVNRRAFGAYIRTSCRPSGIITYMSLWNWWHGPRVLDRTAGDGFIRTAPARVNVDDLTDFYTRLQNILGPPSCIRTSSLTSSHEPVTHETVKAALAVAPYDREVINMVFGQSGELYGQPTVTVSISNNDALASHGR